MKTVEERKNDYIKAKEMLDEIIKKEKKEDDLFEFGGEYISRHGCFRLLWITIAIILIIVWIF